MVRDMNAPNVNSSPPSGGTNTHDGTPSTIPTIMSPEGGHYAGRAGIAIPKLDLTNPDAFVSLASRRNHPVAPVTTSKLPPHVRDFAPGVTPVAIQAPSRVTAIGETKRHPGAIGSSIIGGHSAVYGPRTPSAGSSALPSAVGTFTVHDKTTRAFIVAGVHPGTPGLYETIAHGYQHFASLTNIDASKLMSHGVYSVEFSDQRDAEIALNWTQSSLFHGQEHNTYNWLPKEIASSSHVDPNTVSNHFGEYLVSVNNVGCIVKDFNHNDLLALCAMIGDVKALHQVRSLGAATATFRIEWYDTRVKALDLNGMDFNGYRLTVQPYTPDVVHPHHQEQALRRALRPDYTNSVMAFLTPRGLGNRGSSSHNVVNIGRILNGIDIRTTIMLRNIPNRVDQQTLKRLLDETSAGEYDFMYLRIDFANNCNVGYAFINFMSPMAIIPFATARAGQKWNLFQSDKVAEISYATIQGRDCLIQKFRNSSVMLEQHSFRPKLYYTIADAEHGHQPGTEQRFPEADNHAKLKRSCDNAEHVGLYHPTSSPVFNPSPGAAVFTVPPRNQSHGGVYTYPALNRRAKFFNEDFARLAACQRAQAPATPLLQPADVPPTSLYAPREGQAFRERQRRQGSLFDRGTPSAEIDLASEFGRVQGSHSNVDDYNKLETPSSASRYFRTIGSSVQSTSTGPVYNISDYLGRAFSGLNID